MYDTILKTVGIAHRRRWVFDLLDGPLHLDSPSTHGDRQLASEESKRQLGARGESVGAGGLIQTIQRWLRRSSDEPALETDGGSETAGDHESGATDTSSGFFEEDLSKVDLFKESGITPEQYIISGLRTYGGRLRQKEIVALTDWSKSTVSRTLKSMEADDAIIRIQIGREKVVCLPEASPGHFDTSDTTSQASNAGQTSTGE